MYIYIPTFLWELRGSQIGHHEGLSRQIIESESTIEPVANYWRPPFLGTPLVPSRCLHAVRQRRGRLPVLWAAHAT